MKIDSKNYAICLCVCVCAKTSALLLQSISIKMGKKKKLEAKTTETTVNNQKYTRKNLLKINRFIRKSNDFKIQFEAIAVGCVCVLRVRINSYSLYNKVLLFCYRCVCVCVLLRLSLLLHHCTNDCVRVFVHKSPVKL